MSISPNKREIARVLNCRQVMIEYLNSKISDQDWRAVSDAANDLREIDRELKIRREIDDNTFFLDSSENTNTIKLKFPIMLDEQ